MRSYPALRIVAAISKMVTVLSTAACVGVVFILPSSTPEWVYAAIVVGAAYLALMSWASAEVLLVFAYGGEDVGAMLALSRAAGEVAAKNIELMDRLVKLSELVPIHSPPAPRPVVAEPATTTDAPLVIESKVNQRLRDRRQAEGKCTECGTPLNFARVSIEKKTVCTACDAPSA